MALRPPSVSASVVVLTAVSAVESTSRQPPLPALGLRSQGVRRTMNLLWSPSSRSRSPPPGSNGPDGNPGSSLAVGSGDMLGFRLNGLAPARMFQPALR
jgi:hypothetical protein